MKRGVLLLFCLPLLAQGGPMAVEVAPVTEEEVAARRPFVGTVAPVRTSTVSGELEGMVVEYLAREGERVEKGQPLARLRKRLLEIRIDAARADLELRKQELLELENGSRPEEIEQARAKVGQAEAEVSIRQWKLESAQKLFDRNTISEDELKDARLAARVAEQRLREMRASLDLVEAGPRAERIAQAAARVKAQEAEVARLMDDLEQHTIRAPFSGYVVEERTEVGQWLDKGGAVATVVALDEVDVVVAVLEDYVTAVAEGDQVPVTIDAIPGESLMGTIEAIVPRADPRARTLPVKIRLKNPRQGDGVLLKEGMFARIHLEIGRKRRAVLVPKDALVLGGAQPTVYVYDPESSTARPVPVELGLAVDGRIEVKDGLEPGQQVVVRGNERLRGPNPRVRVAGSN